MPMEGNQPKRTEKNKTNISASQKFGMATPIRAMTMDTESCHLF